MKLIVMYHFPYIETKHLHNFARIPTQHFLKAQQGKELFNTFLESKNSSTKILVYYLCDYFRPIMHLRS